VRENRRAIAGAGASLQQVDETTAIEYVVTQHERVGLVGDEGAADEKGLRDAVRRGLFRVGDGYAPLPAIAKHLHELVMILWCRDEQDIADTGEHQRAQRIVDHRFVVDGQQLLTDGPGHGIEARARAAGEHDAPAWTFGHDGSLPQAPTFTSYGK
jgi:hypothetical protein